MTVIVNLVCGKPKTNFSRSEGADWVERRYVRSRSRDRGNVLCFHRFTQEIPETELYAAPPDHQGGTQG